MTIWLFRIHNNFPNLRWGWHRVSAGDAATLISDGCAQDAYTYVTQLKHRDRGAPFVPAFFSGGVSE